MKYKNLPDFMDYVRARDPSQPEFMQAVQEVMGSVWNFILANPKYADSALLERLVEPERVIQFRVAWTDDHGQTHVNRAFRVQFDLDDEEVVAGRPFFELSAGDWNIPALRAALTPIKEGDPGLAISDLEITHDFAKLGRRHMLVNVRRLDDMPLMLVAIEDITGRRVAERHKELLVSELQHRVKNLIAKRKVRICFAVSIPSGPRPRLMSMTTASGRCLAAAATASAELDATATTSWPSSARTSSRSIARRISFSTIIRRMSSLWARRSGVLHDAACVVCLPD